MNRFRCLALAAITLAVTLTPLAARAQSALATSDAKDYLGTWEVSVNGPMPFTLNLVLADQAGKLGANISSDLMGKSNVTDIAKDGDKLVLKYAADYSGMPIRVKMTLAAAGDKLTVNFEVADPEFSAPGEGKKK